MKKGDVIEGIVIDSMAAEGKCVARIDGQVIFIDGGAPGDTVDVSLTKIKKQFLEGKVSKITQVSPSRVTPFCIHFGTCGGCSWQHIDYAAQLSYKHRQVVDNLERLGGLTLVPALSRDPVDGPTLPEVNNILGSEQIRHYRNKLDFTFSANRWLTKDELTSGMAFGEPALGYHIPRMYDKVFDVKECHLQSDPSNAIRLAVRDVCVRESIPFFDLRKQIGFLRTLTIRTTTTGEVMIILQVTYDKMEWTGKILEELERLFPQITSFQFIINGKRNDTFGDLDVQCWKGNPYITEKMIKPDKTGELQFRVGPKSFYQTNSRQAQRLYQVAWEFAALTGNETVYDLYTGTGTIACFIAANAGKVVGLEYVAAAVEDAKVNSKLNGLNNTDFFAGDIKDLLDDTFLDTHGRPDVVITDPPRAGMHENVTRMLLKASPKRIVYVSCNPATQARDLAILSEKYQITRVQPVDMFPHTVHVENVVVLSLNG
ncbi:MAG TPA: 23S rRNA (uracil(1939)-C(5))-methyltransferase RlmD [Cyclobacteriaceae bacterium]|nr:23S rRNA (uracil(1939)-C(5))-methyltransferase RlmD [Cyclobacteriaceae bacterium]